MTKHNVTRSEYLTDLENTRRELEAYRNLASGYKTLAELPELNEPQRRLYWHRAESNAQSAVKCRAFLDKLESLNPEDFLDD